jgi:hypothetical protein
VDCWCVRTRQLSRLTRCDGNSSKLVWWPFSNFTTPRRSTSKPHTIKPKRNHDPQPHLPATIYRVGTVSRIVSSRFIPSVDYSSPVLNRNGKFERYLKKQTYNQLTLIRYSPPQLPHQLPPEDHAVPSGKFFFFIPN